ncbi:MULTISPECIES: retroviral-like aspartic protease family protein [unclassified Microcoleus]|uniref:retroviral-like aspartic protease family protein n=1 Tax=unclassified Microcoleus TaxID=2642155 RepID=UPI002FD788D1
MTLVLPNLQGKQMGQVLTTITVTNRIDQVLAERGFIPAGEIRSLTLDKVLVDTGATLLALPAFIISQLGLSQLGETNVETAAGIRKGRIFQDIMLELEGRQAVFDCLEMPEGVDAVLLGMIPMERLGLEPDLKNQRLRVLPMNEEQTYLMV